MKILAIGDPHIKSDNIIEFDLFEKRLHSLIDRESPNFIVVLGDVLHYHEKLYTQSLNRAYSFLEKLGNKTTTYVLVGNHDMINNQQFLSDNHWMNGIKLWKNSNVTIVDRAIKVEYNQHIFFLTPYVYPGRFIEALETVSKDWKNASLIFAHQEFKGCKMGAIISEHGDDWDEKFPMVISGHIHQNQTIKNVYYPGSALQHAFGESDKNIIPIIELANDKWNTREEDLDLPRKKIITTDIDKLEKTITKIIEKKDFSDDQIKLTIKGNNEEFKQFKKTDKYKELLDKGVKVVFKPKQIKKITDNNGVTGYFDKVLQDLIIKEKNSELYNLYEKIVNNNSRDEIIII